MQTRPAFSRGNAATTTIVLLALFSFIRPVAAQVENERAQEYLHIINDPQVHITSKESDLEIIEKFTKILEFDRKVRIVDGFDLSVIKVDQVPRAPNKLRVNGVSPGITSMLIIDEADEKYVVNVFVTGDARHLQAVLNREFPKASVRATKLRDAVLLRGWVTQPEHITDIVNIAEVFFPQVINQMRVGGVQQVLLKVKVMEVQRSKTRTLGINFLAVTNGGYIANTIGSIVPVAGIQLSQGGAPTVELNATSFRDNSILFGTVDANHTFQAFLEAMKQESLLKILAEPELVATNGRPANLLSGGEFPILVPQSLGTVTIEYKEFGVRLQAVPIVLGNGRLRMDLEPEVSERDFTNAVEVSGILVPGLTTRRVNTQVEMNLGETLVIAGLIANRNTGDTAKVPWLGELPGVGALFSRKHYEEAETELLIMVTPQLVSPLEPDEVPERGPGTNTDVPVDRELYLDGVLEVPNYGADCQDCPGKGPKSRVLTTPPGLIGPNGAPEGGVMPPPTPEANGANESAETPRLQIRSYSETVTKTKPDAPAEDWTTGPRQAAAANQAPVPPALIQTQASQSATDSRQATSPFDDIAPLPSSGFVPPTLGTQGMRLPVRPGLIEPRPASERSPTLRDAPAPRQIKAFPVP